MDIVIKNGLVIDGSGKKGQMADVAIVADKIVGVGDYSTATARRVIDATGKVVCPGFIDPHTHCGNGNNPRFLRQGVTTVITGNCGFSTSMAKQQEAFAQKSKLTNLGNLVGLNFVRIEAMGGAFDREPTADELEKMKRSVAENIEAGALGVSTGLAYVPGSYTKAEENIELVKVAARYGGFYASHMRNEESEALDAIKETIRVGKESGLPIHISHLKICGAPNFGKSKEMLNLLDAETAKGTKVTFDQYPYVASTGSLRLMFPPWAIEGDCAAIKKRLEENESRKKIKAYLIERLSVFYGGQPERLQITHCERNPEFVGLNIMDVSERVGKKRDIDGVAETIMRLFQDAPSHHGVFLTSYCIDERDVARIMKHPLSAVGSDGVTIPANFKGMVHPRSCGSFPRVLGRYCRELKLFPLEEAVRKMTSLPADIVGLKKRGVLKEGYFADVTIFDPETVIDNATFEKPHQYPTGIDTVIVNGAVELAGDKPTGSEGGRFLTRE